MPWPNNSIYYVLCTIILLGDSCTKCSRCATTERRRTFRFRCDVDDISEPLAARRSQSSCPANQATMIGAIDPNVSQFETARNRRCRRSPVAGNIRGFRFWSCLLLMKNRPICFPLEGFILLAAVFRHPAATNCADQTK